ncbi:hypothetical protein D9758_015679 [Tetrapyrgos nigripes]|uniref:F-box domain-containing protein n=1 Tax=Tetrapyrgos nigripes TaxID=182062 RepID=A0A8H5C9L3_9AGAR|nr:hypothetical protein D9758_015679 [Tetrapyrgos nigripes]
MPSNSEITQVHTRIESANHDLDLYEAEIEKLSQTLSTLKQQRNELQRHRNCCRAVVSSFRRIPPELWAEIFLFALDNQPLLVAEHRIVAPALPLSQTCSLWRNVALGTPRLWSVLDLNVACDHPGAQHLVELYLVRSMPHPLVLTVEAATSGSTVALHEFGSSGQAILKSLVHCGDRWQVANLRLHLSVLNAETIWKSESIQYPVNLRSLRLRWWPRRRILSNDFFFHATELQSLDAFPFRDNLFHLNQLRKLRIRRNICDVLRLFQNCPHLEDVELQSDNNTPTYTVLPPATCSNVRSLKYEFSTFGAPAALFQAITLPSLTCLHIVSYGDDLDSKHAMFLSFRNMLTRSACPLQVLHLRMDPFSSDQELLEIFTVMPTLAVLRLAVEACYGLLTDNLFRTLSFESPDNPRLIPGHTVLLPRLTHFQLELCQVEDLDEDGPPLPDLESIFSMVNSRRLHATIPTIETKQLESFELTADLDSTSVEAIEWKKSFLRVEPHFRALEEGGLHLALTLSEGENF